MTDEEIEYVEIDCDDLERVTSWVRPYAKQLIDKGHHAQIVLLQPGEIQHMPGFNVAIVVPFEHWELECEDCEAPCPGGCDPCQREERQRGA